MPLTEREAGFNEGLDAASKMLNARSDEYYKAMHLIDKESPEVKVLSQVAYRYRVIAGDVYGLRKLSAEEIAEREQLEIDIEQHEEAMGR